MPEQDETNRQKKYYLSGQEPKTRVTSKKVMGATGTVRENQGVMEECSAMKGMRLSFQQRGHEYREEKPGDDILMIPLSGGRFYVIYAHMSNYQT